MNEIERAINLISEGEIDYSGIYDCELNERVTEVILNALREQAERSGCEVCNSLVAMRYETVCDWSDDGKAVWDTNTMRFCPMCGKRLEVEP